MIFVVPPTACKAIGEMMSDYANYEPPKEPKNDPEDNLDFLIWTTVILGGVAAILYYLW